MTKKSKEQKQKQRRPSNQRRAERLRAALPVVLEHAQGVTRDVSASGLFFETDSAYAVGNPVDLVVNLDMPWGKVKCNCRGKIVRLERHDQRIGVAVQFTDATALPRRKPAARAPRSVRAGARVHPRSAVG